MARHLDFIPIRLRKADERAGRRDFRQLREAAKARGEKPPPLRGSMRWAGFAAEYAACHAYDKAVHAYGWVPPTNLRYDFGLKMPQGTKRVELKTRAVRSGWTYPERYEWFTVPTHDGRAPIKPDAEMVLFAWYTYEQPRRLWLLGWCAGLTAFERLATFYDTDEPLPRGGWAPKGGAYSLEIDKLQTLPRGLFAELR